MVKGSMLRDALISGAVVIGNKKREVDELNVYPVPDGDTGTNMSMTMGNALKELRLLDASAPVHQVAEVAASALLRGARGNSGVILSLIFRGFAKALAGKKTATCADLAKALELGSEAAYKAVMKPAEGTILTVVRLASVKAAEIAAEEDVAVFWEQVCLEAEKTLEKTPEMLPVLKKAGVVDAGGKGLVVIFRAMLEVFKGGKVQEAVSEQREAAVVGSAAGNADDEEITFTYCTEFLVQKKEDCKDSLALRAYLETIGDCVVVVDDNDIIKVHVHTDNPGKALEEGLLFGMLTNLKIENMRIQHENRVRETKLMQSGGEFTPAAPSKKFGFVAVGAGKGVEDMFKDLGADSIVRGGQTMNPSTDDILRAILATPAEIVFVLPNNKNIILAAEQASKLVTDRQVCVMQTRFIPQGIAAMLSFDPDADFNQNRIAMAKAIERVQTGQVTFAARDSDYEGRNIKKGEILALENGRLAFSSNDVTKAAYKLTRRLMKNGAEFITLIYGADVTEESALNTEKLFRAKLGDKVEINLINGGQPVYYYIISVE